MKYENMTVEQFVAATNTFRKDDKVGTNFVRKADVAAYTAYVKAHKPEIMAYLLNKEQAEAQAAADRQAKIDGIEGLKELDAAAEKLLNQRETFTKQWESGSGVYTAPTITAEDFEALCKKYPRAAAYREARNGSLASHDVKATAYTKALEKIINGEDYTKALADAAAEWKAYCDEHIWD